MRTKTSFKKGERPVGIKKGSKHKRTEIKEAVGVASWNQLREWVEGYGLERCISELNTLYGKDYVIAYNALTEYIKPKLSRTTVEGGDHDKPIQVNAVEGLSFEQLYQLKYGHKL
jgi:hypothetical protein